MSTSLVYIIWDPKWNLEYSNSMIVIIINQRRQWHPTPVFLPGKSHGQRSLVGCSPWSRSELGRTERLHFHFSLSCIGEGNGNPLQCSCVEIPRDGGAWWAAVYGVTQSRTRLKRLSSSSRGGTGYSNEVHKEQNTTKVTWLANMMSYIRSRHCLKLGKKIDVTLCKHFPDKRKWLSMYI